MKFDVKSAHRGQVVAERYLLEEPLARGGMGRIWRAEHLHLKSRVALKFLEPAIADDPEMFDRFLREAQSAAAVRGAHVVQILDCGVDGGTPYISMELLEGESLEARLAARGRLTLLELDKIFGEVARAVGNAHELGVVHRDLKPGNIFIAREGELEITKVLDFGIAKLMSPTLQLDSAALTSTGTLLGTPHYMSPEQARGSRSLDQRTDLWSLAVIAFECLTGKLPFEGEGIGDIVVRICTHEPLLPSERAGVPPGFDEWFSKGVRKEPSERFASAPAMAEALSSILAPARAKPAPASSSRAELVAEARPLQGCSDGYGARAPDAELGAPASASTHPLTAPIDSASQLASLRSSSRVRRFASFAAGLALLCGAGLFAPWPGPPDAALPSTGEAALPTPRTPGASAPSELAVEASSTPALIAPRAVSDAGAPQSPPPELPAGGSARTGSPRAGSGARAVPRRRDGSTQRPRSTKRTAPPPARPPRTEATPYGRPTADPFSDRL